MVDVKECPVCGGVSFSNFKTCIDYTVSHETFQLITCNACQLTVTSPRPHDLDLGKYYLSTSYISHSGKAETFIDKVYLLARNYTLKKKLVLINSFKNTGRLLDYGCGTGEFINTCKSNGWIVEGVEPSDNARKKAEESNSQKINQSILDIKDKQDVITLWHVLEHVPSLDETLGKLEILLKNDGILFIAVPNYKSHDASHYKNYWAGFDVPRHLWHFEQESMKKLLAKKNLKLEQIVPMKLDSFYVSMLSEKYKNNEKFSFIGLVKAFFTGLRSNVLAMKTGNYSSLIYIARK